MSKKVKYTIFFYTPKSNKLYLNGSIKFDDLNLKEEFSFYDYDSKQTIRNLKIYFLSTFGHKYNNICCCQLLLYRINPKLFSKDLIRFIGNETQLINGSDKKLYLVKANDDCNCLLKEHKSYLIKTKYDLIKTIIDEEKKYLNEKQNLEESLDKIKKENDSLKIIRENLEESLDTIKKENDSLKIKNENLEEFLDNTKNENNILKIQNENLEKFKIRMNKYNEKYNLKEEEFYDVSVEIKSIKDLKKGWKLIMNEKGKNTYLKYKNEPLLKIGAIGNSKKGKSFLLNKISHIDLMIGPSFQSSGLNIKYPDIDKYSNQHIIILDSAGLDKPLLIEKSNMIENEIYQDNENKNDEKNEIYLPEEILRKKEFKDMSKDKILTELFLQKLIIKNSDILLLVIGDLTYSEQILINKITE